MVEPSVGALRDLLGQAEVVVSFPGPEPLRYRVRREDGHAALVREARTDDGWRRAASRARVAVGAVLEMSIPLSELGQRLRRRLEFRVLIVQGGTELQRHPEGGPIEMVLEEVADG